VGDARGKAVKVITQLLPALPMKFHYRIVYVERDLDEVLASQRRMLARDGKAAARMSDEQLRRTFSAQSKRIRGWLAKQPNVEVFVLDYRNVVAHPMSTAVAMAKFVGGECDIERMAAAVDPGLYRTRV
jgi:hypothetical protein